MLKVLLVAPLDPEVPKNLKFLMGGENTYTRTLLVNPPQGVEYIHHSKALQEGLIEYLPIQKILANLVKFRILPLSSGTQAFLVKSHFDLVHCHTYSVKISGRKIPIILSDSSSNYLFLRDYLGWPAWRIAAGYKFRKFLFNKLGISDPDTNLENVAKLVVFSNFAEKIHKNLGASSKKIELIYPGLPKPKFEKKSKLNKINLLFIGIWFERKGGLLLLEAFKILAKKFNNLRLTIIGPIPKKIKLPKLSIFQRDYLPREELIKNIFPQADILVLTPLKAEGYGFVVQEAASFGIPAIVSRVYALPEIVEDGKTGFVVRPGNLADLVEKLEILIQDKALREKFGEAARIRFENLFSIEKSNQKLLKVYIAAQSPS